MTSKIREYQSFLYILGAAIAFFYLYYRLLSDTKKFETLINSESKNTFSKNLRELDRISKKLGPRYVTELKETKEKWKLR